MIHCSASLLLATCIAFLLWANSLFQTRYAQVCHLPPLLGVGNDDAGSLIADY